MSEPTPSAAPQPLADGEDLEASWVGWAGAGPEVKAVAPRLLARASAMVRSRVPNLDARIADGTLDPELPAGVVVDMVVAVLRNPEGWRSETEGPFSGTRDAATATGLLTLTAEQVAQRLPPARRRRRVGQIRLRRALR